MKKIGTLVLFLLVTIAGIVFAENKTALVIGNSAYQHFPALSRPGQEAEAMKSALERLGFEVLYVIDGTYDRMYDALYTFERKLQQRGGIALFHFGGHGIQVNGENYLLPVDKYIPDERRVKSRGVNAAEVVDLMAMAGSRTNIIILDACRDNPLPSAARSTNSRGLARLNAPVNTVVVYSAEAGSTAQDGVFTPALLEYLETPGMSFTDILRKTRRAVYENSGGKQIPGSYDQLFEPVYLAGDHPDTSAEGAERESMDRTIDNTSLSGAGTTADLYIYTDQPGAEVSVNGKAVGESPQMVTGVPLHTRIAINVSNGSMAGRKVLSIEKSGLNEVFIELELGKGSFFIRSSETDVQVYIDGRLLGKYGNGLFKDLPAGKHSIELKGEGLYWEGEVKIESGKTTAVEAEVERVYSIGDKGPAGGIIFYDKGYYSDGWRYMEAAPVSTEWSDVSWGAYRDRVMNTYRTRVGTGAWNTRDIVSFLGPGSRYAAQLCDGLEYGGYDDWFLPSKDELVLLYENLHQRGLGNFSGRRLDSYWSSSEYHPNLAFGMCFDDGDQFNGSKNKANKHVRAVRAF